MPTKNCDPLEHRAGWQLPSPVWVHACACRCLDGGSDDCDEEAPLSPPPSPQQPPSSCTHRGLSHEQRLPSAKASPSAQLLPPSHPPLPSSRPPLVSIPQSLLQNPFAQPATHLRAAMAPDAPPSPPPSSPPRRLNTAMLTNSGASVFPVASWVARTGRLLPPSSAVPGTSAGGVAGLAPSGRAGAATIAFVGGDSDAYNRRMARRSREDAVEAAVGGGGGGAAAEGEAASHPASTMLAAASAGGSPPPEGSSDGEAADGAEGLCPPPAGFFGANATTYGRRWRVLTEVADAGHAAPSGGYVRVPANGAAYDRRMLVRNESV